MKVSLRDDIYSTITKKELRIENIFHIIESDMFSDKTVDDLNIIFDAYRYIFNQHIELCHTFVNRDFDYKLHAHALFTLQNTNGKFKWLKKVPLEFIYKAIRDARDSVKYHKRYDKKASYITKKDSSISISFHLSEVKGYDVRTNKQYHMFISKALPPIFVTNNIPNIFDSIIITKYRDCNIEMYFKN